MRLGFSRRRPSSSCTPGDLFYMPPAVFHKIRNTGGPRVSLSIPVSPAGGKRMDRTYIPFERLFHEGMRNR